MPLESTFHDLYERVNELRSALVRIHAYYEDRPREIPRKRSATKAGEALLEPYPVGRLGDTLVELESTVEEAALAAHECFRLAAESGNLDRLRRALARCQQSISRLEDRVACDLCDYSRLHELRGSLRKHKGEWSGWTAELVPSLCSCVEPLRRVSKALVAGWQEIAERTGSSVSVRSRGIGRVQLVASREIDRGSAGGST
jgi:hypothetical protein